MSTRILGVILVFLLLAVPSFAAPANLSGIRDSMDRGCYQAALKELTAIIEKDQENHEAYAMLAECEIVFGDLDAAETAVVVALEIVEDKNPDYWKLLGRVSFKKGLQAYMNRASASEIKSSSVARSGSSSTCATPPNTNSVMRSTPMPRHLATKQCASSCSSTEEKNSSAVPRPAIHGVIWVPKSSRPRNTYRA